MTVKTVKKVCIQQEQHLLNGFVTSTA